LSPTQRASQGASPPFVPGGMRWIFSAAGVYFKYGLFEAHLIQKEIS